MMLRPMHVKRAHKLNAIENASRTSGRQTSSFGLTAWISCDVSTRAIAPAPRWSSGGKRV